MAQSYMKYDWMGFHKLRRVVILEGKVVNDEPLRIGAGKAVSLSGPIDLVVLRVYDHRRGVEVPVIPGSSWKGVLRATCYKIAQAEGVNVCQGLPNATCLRGREFEAYERRGSANEAEEKLKAIASGAIKVCLGCLVFGSVGFRSHVDLEDSFPQGDYRFGYRTCVAIDRRTGASYRGALFTVEYVEPGCTWSFRLVAVNVPNYGLGWIAKALTEIHEGVAKIGGCKTRGFGRVHFEELELKIAWPREESKLEPLDDIDDIDRVELQPAKATSPEDVSRLLAQLSKAWDESVEKLREVSSKGWVWVTQ